MTPPRIQLDHQSLFWRTVAFVFFMTQLLLWLNFPRRGRPGQRIFLALFSIPSSLILAVALGLLVTILVNLLVNFVIRPLVAKWHTPVVDDSLGPFHLAANEWIVESSPARRGRGWRWPPGVLVRTNQRFWFFPRAYEADVWSCTLSTLEAVDLEPAPGLGWGLIRNWPERIAVRVADDSREIFAVPEPLSVASWLKPLPSKVVVHTVRS